MRTCRSMPVVVALLAVLVLPAWVMAAEQPEKSLPITLADEIEVGGMKVKPSAPPKGLRTDADCGVIVNDSMQVSVMHYVPEYRADCMRAIKTPKGDYLAVVVSGKGTSGGAGHYAPPNIDYNRKDNDFIAYRSKDKGKTWTKQGVLFPVSYGMHGFVPIVAKGTNRIYCFGTEPRPDLREGRENAAIAFRYSEDDGYTWSQPNIIRPTNDPDFKGMSCTQMTQTDSGVWMIGSHEAHWPPPGDKRSEWEGQKMSRLATRQYLLRSEDQGKTWTVLPDKRPNGWYLKDYNRMDEGLPVALGGGNVVLFARTPAGFIHEFRSTDDGKTWSDPKPTTLVQPDAPPAIFFLSDRKTLVALHHNVYDPKSPHFNGGIRNQMWVSTSTDQGRTWAEPRFLLASANVERRYQTSYPDLLAEDGQLNIFVPYGWRQTLQVRMTEADLAKLPTRQDLMGRLTASVTD